MIGVRDFDLSPEVGPLFSLRQPPGPILLFWTVVPSSMIFYGYVAKD